jgi:hypothetical protein
MRAIASSVQVIPIGSMDDCPITLENIGNARGRASELR